MIKRTLYFGSAAYLSVKNEQLIVNYPEDKETKSLPIEDIGILFLDHYQLTITQPLLSNLLDNNVAVISCNERHLPHGMFLNLDGHYTQQAHLSAQIEATEAVKDRLWKQVIQHKISNQASLLADCEIENTNMQYWAKQVKNGDPENMEARAAANYWRKLFDVEFVRGRYDDLPNSLLNYGYAILRAVVARGLVGSGLHPSLGIHHHNKYNAYCLADDLMEAYRPFVDRLVLQVLEEDGGAGEELNMGHKKQLLQIPTLDVMIRNKRSPLMIAVQQSTSSLAACFLKESKSLKLPTWLH
ncbi:MAG: subtype II CRISPR-associated endonuclease Cas1 [Flavobacteriales bacterium]|nr:subtype II CRISPR-associated endonuclease Cas1 [Flavobacteriales bacterium]|tara:strand:- start:1683 stop:2579 length:897 start_codon:yes stop_codon:yes gene_type:complete